MTVKSNLTVLLPLLLVWTVTVFTESHPSDVSETASQSVPMVSTSTGSLTAPGEAVPGDDGDDVFVAEAESEGCALTTVYWFTSECFSFFSEVVVIVLSVYRTSSEACLEGQSEMESTQPLDDASLPSTSQEPTSSSAGTHQFILNSFSPPPPDWFI